MNIYKTIFIDKKHLGYADLDNNSIRIVETKNLDEGKPMEEYINERLLYNKLERVADDVIEASYRAADGSMFYRLYSSKLEEIYKFIKKERINNL